MNMTKHLFLIPSPWSVVWRWSQIYFLAGRKWWTSVISFPILNTYIFYFLRSRFTHFGLHTQSLVIFREPQLILVSVRRRPLLVSCCKTDWFNISAGCRGDATPCGEVGLLFMSQMRESVEAVWWDGCSTVFVYDLCTVVQFYISSDSSLFVLYTTEDEPVFSVWTPKWTNIMFLIILFIFFRLMLLIL